jgi:cell division protein ZipA
MDMYLRLGLTILAGAVVLLIVFEVWHYHRQQKNFARASQSNRLGMNNDDSAALDDAILATRGEQLQLNFESVPLVAPSVTEGEPIKPTLSSRIQTTISVTPQTPLRSLNTVTPQVPLISSNTVTSQTALKSSANTAAKKPMDDLLQMSVVAKRGRQFASYELLQAISATGMQFGEMNIFHYYTRTQTGKKPLFSLASLTKPGYFDLDRMGNFTCAGLVLFTQLREVEDPQQAFELMLKAADQLVDDLDGELRADPATLWNNEILLQQQEKVLHFQLMN